MFKKVFYLHYPRIFMEESYKIMYMYLQRNFKKLPSKYKIRILFNME